MQWQNMVVSPEEIFSDIKPGMNIFISTGVAEPRTLVKHLMASKKANLRDLELIQIVSLGDAITVKDLHAQKYRLKTFFSGWVASEAITEGHVDLIPSRFTKIPRLIESGQIPIDVAFVQVTPPDEEGYCSMGVAVDIARHAIDQASIKVAEINKQTPLTYGDTFIHISDFDYVVESDLEPIYFPRWPVDEVFDQVAANVASIIEDGSCLSFSVGPIYEALPKHLAKKKNLGIHSAFITDALMELIKSGAVTNRNKEIYKGKSLVSYAFGTKDLLSWLDKNHIVEFQGIDMVFNPIQIGKNPKFVAVIPARKVDLSGRIALHIGKGNVAATPGEAVDFINGAELSTGGITIFALPSRNLMGEPNIKISTDKYPNLFSLRESVNMVATEYGVANMLGRTVRERALALIDIAHPDDRPKLVEEAKAGNILYQDQIYLGECSHLYPAHIQSRQTFKGGIEVHFRHIKPSDEDEMRRLFYRFSDQTVYYRYFRPIKVMPHANMQQYVNVDCTRIVSIVGLIGPPNEEHIICEARFVKDKQRPYADIAFVVEEKYQGCGIATFLYKMLIRLAKEWGIKGFTADVLATNKSMLKVFENGGHPIKASLYEGAYELEISFKEG